MFVCIQIFFSVQERKFGQRLNVIIVAEGAIDQDGKIITPDYVKDVSFQLSSGVFIGPKC